MHAACAILASLQIPQRREGAGDGGISFELYRFLRGGSRRVEIALRSVY
jgi:hypothetical protein